MANVLCTGSNSALTQTRLMLLQQAGHNAIGTLNEQEVVEACKAYPIDVAVVGQSISPVQKNRVLILVGQYRPTARILELYIPSTGRALGDADDWLEVLGEYPEHLAERVTALAKQR